MQVGFIGGSGWMGRHVVKAMVREQQVRAADCWVSNQSGDFSELSDVSGLNTTTDNQAVCEACDVLFLCVRSKHVKQLPALPRNQLVISIMAGVSVATISQHLNTDNVVRCMPNAAIEVYQAMTPWMAASTVSQAQKDQVQAWLSSFGLAMEVQNEDHLNFLTALSGSSHGSIAYMQMAMVNAAVDHGIPSEQARQIVQQVFTGTSQYMQQHDRIPSDDVDLVIDYDGTTAALCRKLGDLGVDQRIAQAVLASYDKASKGMS